MTVSIFRLNLILLITLTLAESHDVSNLVAAVVVFRHGSRTPAIFFGNDPYANKSYWPEGIGELTERGKTESYQLGMWLRSRYDGFLSREYTKQDIYMKSTDLDRSITSAQLVAAGLYSSNDDFSSKHQTIPIHTTPVESDMLLRTYRQCTNFYTMYENYCKTEYFDSISNYSALNAYLLKHLGQSVEPHRVVFVHDTWSFEESYNLSLPEWTSEVYPHSTSKIALLDYAARTYSTEIARMAIGVLFHEIKTYFLQMREFALLGSPQNKEYLPKMKLYSAHDFNLIDMKSVLGVFDFNFVGTSSALIIELMRNNDSFYVNLYFKDQDIVDELNLERCNFDCELDIFLGTFEAVTITAEEWTRMCGYQEEECHQNVLQGILLYLCILVLIFLTIYYMYRARRQACNNQDCSECKRLKQENIEKHVSLLSRMKREV